MSIETLLHSRDKAVERMVLSRVLCSKRLPPDLNPEYFTEGEKVLFCEIERQWREHGSIDTVLLKSKFPETFSSVLSVQGSYTEAALETLHNRWMERKIGDLVLSASNSSMAPTEILNSIQRDLAAIAFKKGEEVYNQHEQASKVLEALERGYKEQRETAGYQTGLIEFDKVTSGIQVGKLYVVGALKKTGKSRFGVYLSMKLIAQGAGVLWESLEMDPFELNKCAASYLTGVNSKNFGRKISDEDYNKVIMQAGNIAEIPWLIYRDKTVEQIRTRILYERANKKIDVVFIDYLQRMKALKRHQKRSDEIEELSIGLADLTRELQVAIILYCQLSGAAENLDENTIPDMRYLKESQAPAEAADVIINLHNFKRNENPYGVDGGYVMQDIHMLIAQRYDVSGCSFRVLGDLRTCQFKNHYDPYGREK